MGDNESHTILSEEKIQRTRQTKKERHTYIPLQRVCRRPTLETNLLQRRNVSEREKDIKWEDEEQKRFRAREEETRRREWKQRESGRPDEETVGTLKTTKELGNFLLLG